jgi:hypothetical protein
MFQWRGLHSHNHDHDHYHYHYHRHGHDSKSTLYFESTTLEASTARSPFEQSTRHPSASFAHPTDHHPMSLTNILSSEEPSGTLGSETSPVILRFEESSSNLNSEVTSSTQSSEESSRIGNSTPPSPGCSLDPTTYVTVSITSIIPSASRVHPASSTNCRSFLPH